MTDTSGNLSHSEQLPAVDYMVLVNQAMKGSEESKTELYLLTCDATSRGIRAFATDFDRQQTLQQQAYEYAFRHLDKLDQWKPFDQWIIELAYAYHCKTIRRVNHPAKYRTKAKHKGKNTNPRNISK